MDVSRRKTRVIIISDTHGADLNFSSLPAADLAVHCGDLTSTGKLDEHAAAVRLLETLPAPTKLVIAGNHDLTLDQEYCADKKSTDTKLYSWDSMHTLADLKMVERMYTGSEAQKNGIHYLSEGHHVVRLQNGTQAAIYASPYTPEFCGWAFAYDRAVGRFSTDSATHSEMKTSVKTDVVITHGPPKGILDRTIDSIPVGCDHLYRAVSKSRPLLHCFGHIHEAWGSLRIDWNSVGVASANQPVMLETDVRHETVVTDQPFWYCDLTELRAGQETEFVNASIMDIQYQPVQKPWVVDLMLPVCSESDDRP